MSIFNHHERGKIPIGDDIRIARSRLGYSQEYVAGWLGISKQRYRQLENEEQDSVTMGRLSEIAFVLETDIETLVIKNSGSCPGPGPWTVLFSTIAGANNNPPATPTKDLSIQLSAFRNELDPSDPFSFENADYILGFEVLDPDGNKIQVVDGNGIAISELLVDSENAVLGMFAKDQPVGKYTLKLKIRAISDPPV